MPTRCVAGFCSNTYADKVSFFRFPKDATLRNKWIAQVNTTRQEWMPSKSSVLCSDHFDADCFDFTNDLRISLGFPIHRSKILLPDAIPTIFRRDQTPELGCSQKGTPKSFASKHSQKVAPKSSASRCSQKVTHKPFVSRHSQKVFNRAILQISDNEMEEDSPTPSKRRKSNQSCCVPDCRKPAYVTDNGRHVTFHVLPKDPKRLKMWIAKIGREVGAMMQISGHTRICSRHFLDSDFRTTYNGRKFLNPNSIPSIFNRNKSQWKERTKKNSSATCSTTGPSSMTVSASTPPCGSTSICTSEVTPMDESGQRVKKLLVYINKKINLDVSEEANSAPNQTSQTDAYMQEMLLKEHNAIPDEYGMFSAIEKYASATRNARIKLEVHEGRFAAVLVTNYMHRIHKEFGKTSEVVFVDTTSTGENCHNVAVTPILCAGPVAAVPLGVVFTSSQEEISYTSGFLLLKKVLDQDGFFGEGHPRCFITPTCNARQKALKAVWPQSSVYCNIPEVLREIWSWLCTTSHDIEMEYQLHLMKTAKTLVYADCESTFLLMWDAFWQSTEALPYTKYTSYLRKVMERRHEWGLGQGAESQVPGDQADSYAESAMCITKDIIQNRCKNFNTYQIITFMNEDYDVYMKQLLLDAVLGQQQTMTLVNYSSPVSNIRQEDNLIFKIRDPPFHGELYTVDLTARICDCSDGQTGAVCKHLVACSERHLLKAPRTKASAPEYKLWIASIAHGIKLSELESCTKLQNLPVQSDIKNSSTTLQDKCVANEVHHSKRDNNLSDSLETSPSSMTKKSIDFSQFKETFLQVMRDYADNSTHEFLAVFIKRLRAVKSTRELNSFLSSALASVKDEMGDRTPEFANENQCRVYVDVAQEPGDLAKKRLSTSDHEEFPNFSGKRKYIKEDNEDSANSSGTKKWEFIKILGGSDALQSEGEDKDAFHSDVKQEMNDDGMVLVKQEHDIDDSNFSGDC